MAHNQQRGAEGRSNHKQATRNQPDNASNSKHNVPASSSSQPASPVDDETRASDESTRAGDSDGGDSEKTDPSRKLHASTSTLPPNETAELLRLEEGEEDRSVDVRPA